MYVKKSFNTAWQNFNRSSNFGCNWSSFHRKNKKNKKCQRTGLRRHPETRNFFFGLSVIFIPAWPVAALVSLSKTLNHNCFILWMGRKAVGPVCCVMHVKEKGLAPVFLDLRLEHPAGWICARYKSSVLLLLLLLVWVHVFVILKRLCYSIIISIKLDNNNDIIRLYKHSNSWYIKCLFSFSSIIVSGDSTDHVGVERPRNDMEAEVRVPARRVRGARDRMMRQAFRPQENEGWLQENKYSHKFI